MRFDDALFANSQRAAPVHVRAHLAHLFVTSLLTQRRLTSLDVAHLFVRLFC